MRPGALLLASVLVAASGCSTPPRYSQAQLNAIETRIVDAPFDEAFNAASGALFDAGYIIVMSDREGGLLTASQRKLPSGWDFWFGSAYGQVLTVSVHVREIDGERCQVRLKTAADGASTVNKEHVDEIWVLMQRQVLMSEPEMARSP